MKTKRRKSGFGLRAAELLLAAVFLFSAGKIGYTLFQYHKGEAGYEAIRNQVAPSQAPKSALTEETALGDFDALQRQYPQAVGWLYCEETEIDYPVMQADDNDYYLRRLPDGQWNLGGSLFLDYRSASDFSGELSLIYGHNMNDGSMFACLENYREQSWYDEHPVFLMETERGTSSLQVLYGFSIPAQEWTDRGFEKAENREQLIDYAAAHTTFSSAVQRDENAPLVALLTCTSSNNQNRYVLICQMTDSI